jgi:hypothetical protein
MQRGNLAIVICTPTTRNSSVNNRLLENFSALP